MAFERMASFAALFRFSRREGMKEERERRAFRGGTYRVLLVMVPRGIQLNGY